MNQKRAVFLWALFSLAFWKLSFRTSFGAHHISFSCFTIVLPLIGAFLSRRASSLCSMSVWGLAHLAHFPITMGIPTYFATLSWNAKDRSSKLALHVFLPLTCMALFFFTAEAGSWPYALYWLVPILLHFFPFGIPSHALQNTFVAHAVGSVIWALFIPMTAASWLSLIPIVAIERLFMATMSASLLWILQNSEQRAPILSHS